MPFVPSFIDYALLVAFVSLFLLCGGLTTLWFMGPLGRQFGSRSNLRHNGSPQLGNTNSLDLLEYLLLVPLSAILVTSFVLLITAEFGFFRFRFWLSFLFLYDLTLFLVFRRKLVPWIFNTGSGRMRASQINFAALAIGVFALLTFSPVSEYVTTQRDPGEYVNIGVRVSETGSLRFSDPDFQGFDSEEKQNLFLAAPLVQAPNPEVMPGFNLVNPSKGLLVPQYFHLFPLWLALGFKLWRFQGIFWMNVLFGLLSVLVMVPLAGRIFKSRPVGYIAALLMLVSPAQVWIVRSPFSEILTQLLLLAGVWMLGVAAASSHWRASLLAGLFVGATLLVRFDSVLIVAVLIVLTTCLMTTRGSRLHCFPERPFLLGTVLVSIYALLHALLFSYPYLETVLDSTLGPPFRNGLVRIITGQNAWGAVAASGLTVLLASISLWRWLRPKRPTGNSQVPAGSNDHLNESGAAKASLIPPREDERSQTKGWLFIGLLIGISLLGFYGYFIRPTLSSARELVVLSPPHSGTVWLYNEINLPRLGWYLTPLGLLCAYVGLLIALKRLIRQKDLMLLPFLFSFIATSIFFLAKSRIFPDNYWVIRRYVPFVIPGCLLLTSLTVVWIAGLSRNPRGTRHPVPILRYLSGIVSGVVLILLLTGNLGNLMPFMRKAELRGSLLQLGTLAGMLQPADIVLIENGRSEDFFSGPLKCIFHEVIYPLGSQHPSVSSFEKLVGGWLKQGMKVKLIASEEATALPSQGIQFIPQTRLEFRTEWVESPYDRLPRVMEILRLHLQIYEVQGREGTTVPTSIPVNFGYNFGFRASGFYRTELTTSDETYRWTDALAAIDLPGINNSTDALLILRLGQDLPQGVELGPARIFFNGESIAEGRFRGKLRVVKYLLPQSLLNLKGVNTVEFHTPTFSPAGQGFSEDKRELGLMLDSLKLQSLIPISSANPYQVNLSSELGDVDADLSGFYLRGSDQYRWAEPIARIDLPVALKNNEELQLVVRAVKSCPDPGFRQMLTASLDGKKLGSTELTGVGDQFNSYRFPIPRKWKRSRTPSVEIRVDPPWTPKSSGQSVDWRSLGCAVDWVRIEGSR